MEKKFRLLALNGGGTRGILQAAFLYLLEKETNKKISELFDMVVGTSTGGIIASAIAKGVPAERIYTLYLLNSHKIFSRDIGWMIKSGFGVFDSKYKINGLETAIAKYLGRTSISKAKVPFITTSYDTLSERIFLFKSWDESQAKYSFTDAAIATACAPTMFPPYKLDNYSLVDGSIYSGNPVLIGAVEGVKQGFSLDEIHILNLGTGYYNKPHDTKAFGIKEWLVKGKTKPLIDMIINSCDEKDSYLSGKLFPNHLYLNEMLGKDYPLDITNLEALSDLTVAGEVLYNNNRESILDIISTTKKPLHTPFVFNESRVGLSV
jgi:uncharacterized protein